jgi:spermidine synthase
VSGFLALAYEVAWTRVLLYVLSASIHAFTIMLTTFLAGLALGSFALAGRVARLRRGVLVFGILEIGIGAAALGTIALLAHYPALHGALLVLLGVRDWGDLVRAKFVEAGLVVLAPTLLLGMTFPLVSQLYARDLPQLGRRIGTMIAVNTAGAVLGSFAAGFLLIPRLGTQGTIVLLAVANAALGGVLLRADPSWRRGRAALAFAPAAALLALSFALPKHAFLPVFGMNIPRSEVAYVREGITGTVTILDTPSSVAGAPPLRVLAINGADVAGTSLMLRTTQKLQAHIPLLLHPHPRDVLQVGLGSGETAHSILMHPIERLVGCDISPEVIEAGAHFRDINRDVYADPRLSIVIEDAKNYIACTERTFDLILNDSVHPIFRGSSDLYAREYFETCRAKLRAGGMMSSWFPIGLLAEDDLRMLLRTFHDVFPTSTVWVATNAVTRNALLLGWKDEPAPRVDLARIERVLRTHPAVASDLAEVGLVTIPALLDAFMLDPDALAALTKGARVNTYDRPYLEFSAPKVLVRGDRQLFANNFAALTSHRSSILPYLVHLGPDADAEARVRERFRLRAAASEALIRGLTHEVEGRSDLAQAAFQEALQVLPNDPLASGLVQRGDVLRESVERRVADGTAAVPDYVQLARWRREAGARDEAIALLKSAIEKRPDALQAHLELVPLLLDAGDVAGAQAEADRVLALDDRMPEMYAVRGRIKAMSGDAGGAEADLLQASGRGARLPWAEVMLGKLLREKGREDEARAHFRNAIEWAPDSPAASEAKQLLGR